MEKGKIDNIDTNKTFQCLKLLQTILSDSICIYKSYLGHIEYFSVPRVLKRANLGPI